MGTYGDYIKAARASGNPQEFVQNNISPTQAAAIVADEDMKRAQPHNVAPVNNKLAKYVAPKATVDHSSEYYKKGEAARAAGTNKYGKKIPAWQLAPSADEVDASDLKADQFYYDEVAKILGHRVDSLPLDSVKSIYEQRTGDESPYLNTGSDNPYYTPLMAEIDQANNPELFNEYKRYSEGANHDTSAYWDANRPEVHNAKPLPQTTPANNASILGVSGPFAGTDWMNNGETGGATTKNANGYIPVSDLNSATNGNGVVTAPTSNGYIPVADLNRSTNGAGRFPIAQEQRDQLEDLPRLRLQQGLQPPQMLQAQPKTAEQEIAEAYNANVGNGYVSTADLNSATNGAGNRPLVDNNGYVPVADLNSQTNGSGRFPIAQEQRDQLENLPELRLQQGFNPPQQLQTPPNGAPVTQATQTPAPTTQPATDAAGNHTILPGENSETTFNRWYLADKQSGLKDSEILRQIYSTGNAMEKAYGEWIGKNLGVGEATAPPLVGDDQSVLGKAAGAIARNYEENQQYMQPTGSMADNSFSRALENRAQPDTNIFREDVYREPPEQEIDDAYQAYIDSLERGAIGNSAYRNTLMEPKPTTNPFARNGRVYTGTSRKAQNPSNEKKKGRTYNGTSRKSNG